MLMKSHERMKRKFCGIFKTNQAVAIPGQRLVRLAEKGSGPANHPVTARPDLPENSVRKCTPFLVGQAFCFYAPQVVG